MFTSTTSDQYPFLDQCPPRPLVMEREKWKSIVELAPNCPRCASSNTKFCYYNNYSLSQPRYFCKGCRRYWTKGGSLRNVPVGGGCRKSRRARSARQGDRTGTNVVRPVPSPVGSANEPDSPDIDLAAVFAKYVSQDVESEDKTSGEESSSNTSYVSSDPAAASMDINSQLEDVMFDCHQQGELINGAQFLEGIPDQVTLHGETNNVVQDFMVHNPQDMQLGDDVGAEIDQWSGDTNLPDFTSQYMVQFQDFGLYAVEDQLRVSGTLVNDNWGSFDFSGFENF